MVGSLAGDRAILPPRLSLSLSHPSSFIAIRRKSLRLTGSHGITGTRDIYASVSTDRSITRNKEIVNLLQEPSTAPSSSSSFPVVGTLPSTPDLLPLLRYCPPSSRRGSGPRVISAFMGRDRHGSSGNVPDDGEKKLRHEWVVGCSERGTKLIIRALLATTKSISFLSNYCRNISRRRQVKASENI